MSKESLVEYIKKLHGVTKDIQDKLQNGGEDGGGKKLTGTDFESMVYDSLLEAGFEKDAITHSTQRFPDFVLEDIKDGDKIGVEVKKTDASKWAGTNRRCGCVNMRSVLQI